MKLATLRLTASVAMVIGLASVAMADVPNTEDTLALAGRIDNNSFDRSQLALGNQAQYWMPVFDTLLRSDTKGEIIPNVAESFAYNDDQTVLTLTLKPGLTFSDGAAVDAEAVKANLEFLKTGGGANSYMARLIGDVVVKDALVAELHLLEPDPALVWNLTTAGGALASPASLGADGSDQHPIGSGPYVYNLDESVVGRQYVYDRNPDYWNAVAYPYEHITITPMTDTVARMNALTTGQVDGALATTKEIAMAEASGLNVNLGAIDFFGLTLADRDGVLAPPVGDVRVRQAINMAFDSASILEFVDLGYGELTNQIFSNSSDAFLPELQTRYHYDPDAARALLAEAGYPDGFTLDMPQVGAFAHLEPIVTQQLADIGITVKWAALPPGSALPHVRSGKYPAFVFAFGSMNAWTDVQQYLSPDASFNPLKVDDPTLSALIDKAQFSAGEEQIAAFKEINRFIVEQAWFAPWYRVNNVYLTRADTKVEIQPDNVVPYIPNFAPAD